MRDWYGIAACGSLALLAGTVKNLIRQLWRHES